MAAELPTLALTLIQPWATLVIRCGKDVENRTWAPGSRLPIGGRFWIHAGKKLDEEVVADMRVDEPVFRMWEADEGVPRGALLGHVRLVAATHVRTSRWHMSGQIGWYLDDVVVLPKPIPCRGAQQLWEVPADVLDVARADIADAARSAEDARRRAIVEARRHLGFETIGREA